MARLRAYISIDGCSPIKRMDYDEVLHARGMAQHCKRHVPVTLTVGSVPCTRQVQLQAWEGAISIIS